jgi:hypothetical protein
MNSCIQDCANIIPCHILMAEPLYQMLITWCTAIVHYLHMQTLRYLRVSPVSCVHKFVLSIRLLKEVIKC